MADHNGGRKKIKNAYTNKWTWSEKRKAKTGARKSESDCTIYAILIIGLIQFFIMPITNGGVKTQQREKNQSHTFSDSHFTVIQIFSKHLFFFLQFGFSLIVNRYAHCELNLIQINADDSSMNGKREKEKDKKNVYSLVSMRFKNSLLRFYDWKRFATNYTEYVATKLESSDKSLEIKIKMLQNIGQRNVQYNEITWICFFFQFPHCYIKASRYNQLNHR